MPLFLFFPPLRWCSQGSTPRWAPLSPGILCGSWGEPHITNSSQAVGVVIGARNLSNSKRRSRRSIPKLTHKDKGIVFWHNGGINRARASFQNKPPPHKPTHHPPPRST